MLQNPGWNMWLKIPPTLNLLEKHRKKPLKTKSQNLLCEISKNYLNFLKILFGDTLCDETNSEIVPVIQSERRTVMHASLL